MTKIKKEKYVRVTMEFEEYLTRWCGMYYSEAEILAKVLGFDQESMQDSEEDSNEEYQSYEDWIDSKVANIEIIEKARLTKDYSALTPAMIVKIKEAVDANTEIKKSLASRISDAITKYFGGSKQEKTIDQPVDDSLVSLPIIKSADELKKEILFICYEPNVEDAHGEWTDVETLRKACNDFNLAMENGNVFPNLFHSKGEDGQYVPTDSFSIVKSYIAESDCIIGDQQVSEGTWLMLVKLHSDTLWDMFLEGTVKGISIGCKGIIGE